MTAAECLRQLWAAGATWTTEDESRIRFKIPRGRVTQELRAALVRCKFEILALLAASPDETSGHGRCRACRRTDAIIYLVMDDGTCLCSRCWSG